MILIISYRNELSDGIYFPLIHKDCGYKIDL